MTVAMTARTALDEMGSDGSFKRRESAWRNWISKGKYVEFNMTFFFEKSFDRLDSLTQHWKFSTKRGGIEIPA
jgi:glutathionyl-hydroquinone reductase